MFIKRTAGKTINTVFPAENDYPQNKKINFVIFYNDLCIHLNSNEISGYLNFHVTNITVCDMMKVI